MKKFFFQIRNFLHSRTLMDFLYLGLLAFFLVKLYDFFVFSGAENPALNILFFLPVFTGFAYLLFVFIRILVRDRKNYSVALILLTLIIYLYVLFEILNTAYLVFT